MSLRINSDSFALLRASLQTIWPHIGSSHADEALSAYCGYRTYAALQARLPVAPAVLAVEENPIQLVARLSGLGHAVQLADVDRMRRLFGNQMLGLVGENFRHMAATPANDNGEDD